MKRLVHSKHLADKWCKIGYKIVALSYFTDGPITFHLEKKL